MKFRRLGVLVFAFAASLIATGLKAESGKTPAVLVKGLIMVSMDGTDSMIVAVPDAPGHRALITVTDISGNRRVLPLEKGTGVLTTSVSVERNSKIRVPELVQIQELYGNSVGKRLENARTTIAIPWSSIRDVKADQVTKERYTFVREDTGEEINSFRPRQIAESLRIELVSAATLKIGNRAVNLENAQEIGIEYLPDHPEVNAYENHFHHYLHYLTLPQDKAFNVVPRKLSGPSAASVRVGNSFYPPYYLCYTLGL
jgi:hypothetical protein